MSFSEQYLFDASQINNILNGGGVNQFHFKLIYDQNNNLSVDCAAVDSNGNEIAVVPGVSENRNFNINVLQNLTPIGQQELTQLGPEISSHLLQPAVAYAYLFDWDQIIASGAPLQSYITSDGQLIQYFEVTTAVIQKLSATQNTAKIALYWGLSTQNKVTTVFIGINNANQEMIKGGDQPQLDAGYILDVTIPRPPWPIKY